MTSSHDGQLDPDDGLELEEGDGCDPDLDDALSIDAVLARVPVVALTRRLEEGLAESAHSADVELRGLLVRAVFGCDVSHEYCAVFNFDPLDLLTSVGAGVNTVFAFSPHGPDYVTFGLTRLTLGGRGCLLSWYSGDDDCREWVAASWSPAAARLRWLEALSAAFTRLDEEYHVFDVRDDAAIGNFASAGDLLDQCWRERHRTTWRRWLERWVARLRDAAPTVAAELTESGEPVVKAAAVGDVAAFIEELLRRGDRRRCLRRYTISGRPRAYMPRQRRFAGGLRAARLRTTLRRGGLAICRTSSSVGRRTWPSTTKIRRRAQRSMWRSIAASRSFMYSRTALSSSRGVPARVVFFVDCFVVFFAAFLAGGRGRRALARGAEGLLAMG